MWITVESLRELSAQLRGIQSEIPDNVVQVAVLLIEHLVDEVMQLDTRVAAQFAKGGGSLHGAVAKLIEPSEQISCSDL